MDFLCMLLYYICSFTVIRTTQSLRFRRGFGGGGHAGLSNLGGYAPGYGSGPAGQAAGYAALQEINHNQNIAFWSAQSAVAAATAKDYRNQLATTAQFVNQYTAPVTKSQAAGLFGGKNHGQGGHRQSGHGGGHRQSGHIGGNGGGHIGGNGGGHRQSGHIGGNGGGHIGGNGGGHRQSGHGGGHRQSGHGGGNGGGHRQSGHGGGHGGGHRQSGHRNGKRSNPWKGIGRHRNNGGYGGGGGGGNKRPVNQGGYRQCRD